MNVLEILLSFYTRQILIDSKIDHLMSYLSDRKLAKLQLIAFKAKSKLKLQDFTQKIANLEAENTGSLK